jgi:soluble lytic murein transglycosylase-like protein
MPKTASALGVADRFDPRESIRGGVRHLRYLLERYQGSVVLALAAYNAGEGAVDTHRGVPPYPETQQYVRSVLRRAGLADSRASAEGLYRHAGSDDVMTYSNLPPGPRHRVTIDGSSGRQP